MQQENLKLIYSVIMFVPFFLLIWMLLSAMLAELSGWRLLLRRYTHHGPRPAGKRFSFVSAQIRKLEWLPVNYKSCLAISVNRDGFLLEIFLLLRFRSPTLFIPFGAIENIEILPPKGFSGHKTCLSFKDLPVKMLILGPAGDAVNKAFNEANCKSDSQN